MSVLLTCIIVLSHLACLIPTYWRLKRKEHLLATDFAVVSCILFYDLGLIAEIAGMYESAYFDAFFESEIRNILLGSGLMATAPWFVRIGTALVWMGKTQSKDLPRLRLKHRSAFYFTTSIISLSIAVIGARLLEDTIWASRARVGAVLGPLVIILYLPLYILAFYVSTEEARTRFGRVFAVVLSLAVILATLPLGQRTTVLLPLLILLLFAREISLTRLARVGAALLILASVILPFFKWQYAGSDSSMWSSLITQVVSGDLARAPVLAAVLYLAQPIGTVVLPYSGSGFVYSMLFFMPRTWVPFKGYATASYFTSAMVSVPVETLSWGFGMGVVEELALNFGVALVPLGLILYGVAMGLMSRLASKVHALTVPTSLAGLWICGYHLPAILLLFGAMFAVCLGLNRVFAWSPSARSSASRK